MGTSVGTLRKALAHLEGLGLLDRRQGSGNYVRKSHERETVYAFFRIERLAGGGAPSAEVLSVDRLPKPVGAPDFGNGTAGHRIRRLRRLDGIPAVVEEIWLDGTYADRLEAEALRESLYLTYKETLGLWISRAEDWVSVGKVPEWSPASFGRKSGDVAGFVERISWSLAGVRAEWSLAWCDPAVAKYVHRLK